MRSRFLKTGLAAARINLWTSTCSPSSQARVTSAKSLEVLSFLIELQVFALNSSQLTEIFPDMIFLPRFSQSPGTGTDNKNIFMWPYSKKDPWTWNPKHWEIGCKRNPKGRAPRHLTLTLAYNFSAICPNPPGATRYSIET